MVGYKRPLTPRDVVVQVGHRSVTSGVDGWKAKSWTPHMEFKHHCLRLRNVIPTTVCRLRMMRLRANRRLLDLWLGEYGYATT